MTEVLVEYENVNGKDASVWAARACGRPLKEKWEAWIEFIPLSAGQFPVRTPRETTQRDRDRESAVEWATGITPTYLEGHSSVRANAPSLSQRKWRLRCSRHRRPSYAK